MLVDCFHTLCLSSLSSFSSVSFWPEKKLSRNILNSFELYFIKILEVYERYVSNYVCIVLSFSLSFSYSLSAFFFSVSLLIEMKGFLIKLKKNETFCRKKTSEVIIESNINKNKIKTCKWKRTLKWNKWIYLLTTYCDSWTFEY